MNRGKTKERHKERYRLGNIQKKMNERKEKERLNERNKDSVNEISKVRNNK